MLPLVATCPTEDSELTSGVAHYVVIDWRADVASPSSLSQRRCIGSVLLERPARGGARDGIREFEPTCSATTPQVPPLYAPAFQRPLRSNQASSTLTFSGEKRSRSPRLILASTFSLDVLGLKFSPGRGRAGAGRANLQDASEGGKMPLALLGLWAFLLCSPRAGTLGLGR